MNAGKIKFLLLFLNRLELIILHSKENVVEKKAEKKNLFQIPQFQLLELLTQVFFSLAVPSCTSIMNYEDINIFGGCNEEGTNKKFIFLCIFSFHVQTQNIQLVLD